MAEGGQDPWESEVYRRNHKWLINLDAVFFRNKAFETGLITGEEMGVLASLGGGKQIHNERLLTMGKAPGGHRSFFLLVKTVRLFGDKYDEQRKDLERVLQVVASLGGGEPPREPAGGAEFDRNRSLFELADTYEFGEKLRKCLDGKQRKTLFKECVKENGDNVDNFSEIVFDYIQDHGKGDREFNNIAGLLFYYRSKTDKTAGNLYDLMVNVNEGCKRDLVALLKDQNNWEKKS